MLATGRKNLSQIVYRNREDDGVADGLDHPDRDLDRSSLEHAALGTESIGNVLAQFDVK